MTIYESAYPEIAAGGFSAIDGTVQFYTRINALIRPNMTVLDLGAGRSTLAEYPATEALATLRGKVAKVIGIDVDAAVLDNPVVDQAMVYDGVTLPLDDASIDLIVCDFVLEHVAQPDVFVGEIHRVLKPGGWFCGRTPHLFSLAVLAASLTPNRYHVSVLTKAQPDRLAEDVFPTVYKLNTRRAISTHFRAWKNASYTCTAEPAYHFNSRILLKLMQVYQYVKKPFLGGEVLMVFVQRPAESVH